MGEIRRVTLRFYFFSFAIKRLSVCEFKVDLNIN